MSVRVRGLVLILGSAAAAGLVYGLLSLVLGHSAGSVRVPLISALPLVGVLVGVIELVSGVPFTRVAAAWESLPQAVRVVLGTLLTIAALVVVFGGGIWVLKPDHQPVERPLESHDRAARGAGAAPGHPRALQEDGVVVPQRVL